MFLQWKQRVWLFIPPKKAFSKHQIFFAEMKLSFPARWVSMLKIHPVLTKLFSLVTGHAVVAVQPRKAHLRQSCLQIFQSNGQRESQRQYRCQKCAFSYFLKKLMTPQYIPTTSTHGKTDDLRKIMKVNEYYSCAAFPGENTCFWCSPLMGACLGEVSTFDYIYQCLHPFFKTFITFLYMESSFWKL